MKNITYFNFKNIAFLGGLLLFLSSSFYAVSTDIYESTLDIVPDGYHEADRFKLRRDYPSKSKDSNRVNPWDTIEFKNHNFSKIYAETVLRYFLAENVDNDFKIPDTQKTKWYHAPAMHFDEKKGREFFRGLTRERDSGSLELDPQQKQIQQNWAIAFYNDIGASEIGEVWKNKDEAIANFPKGTVAAKLLFTHDTIHTLAYLEGTLKWKANIPNLAFPKFRARNYRKPHEVKLIQIDLAIKDRSSPIGWVFTSFVYHKKYQENKLHWYDHLLCIGVSWGNDTNSQWINQEYRDLKKDFNNLKTWQLGGNNDSLLNGPVDNPNSSCISCHSTSKHKNRSMDFSLQLDTGMKAYAKAQK